VIRGQSKGYKYTAHFDKNLPSLADRKQKTILMGAWSTRGAEISAHKQETMKMALAFNCVGIIC